MDEEKIVSKIKNFLEVKEGLNVKECLVISKLLLDDFFDEIDWRDEGEDEDEFADEDEDDFEEPKQEDFVESVNQFETEKQDVETMEARVSEGQNAQPGDIDYEPGQPQNREQRRQVIRQVEPGIKQPITIKQNNIEVKTSQQIAEPKSAYVKEIKTQEDIDDGDF